MARTLINNLFGRPPPTTSFPDPSPDTTVIALGDIHGRVDLLQRFFDLGPAYPVICVGDYVDRGDCSADVLRLLHARPDVTCLSGNHEEMMLRFLDAPEDMGPRWLRYGGLQTLASFGISGLSEASRGSALRQARDALADAMGSELLSWMRGLPTRWQTGNVTIVHAGADPGLPIASQTTQTLHWGHPDFHKKPRTDGTWIVHGHTIVDAPEISDGRVAIDTGAYATGKLSAALIAPGEITFETVT